jgi:sirohydrochlorin cobaltochelatase
MDAVILFSHGSLLCGAGEALDEHAERIRQTGRWPVVTVGYMNYSEPSFLDAVKLCLDQGADSIIVVRFFLVSGFFVKKTLPERIAEAQAAYPELSFTIAPALGFDVRLADAILESAANPLGKDDWRGDLASAARGCRANPECPLYGTPKCPLVPHVEPVFALESSS